ncbi:MAG TPA: hypothetical protein VKS60_05775, partial [Stellaceae bacterium]|nr:hypothetical protein [Stellaceae bacterium]
ARLGEEIAAAPARSIADVHLKAQVLRGMAFFPKAPIPDDCGIDELLLWSTFRDIDRLAGMGAAVVASAVPSADISAKARLLERAEAAAIEAEDALALVEEKYFAEREPEPRLRCTHAAWEKRDAALRRSTGVAAASRLVERRWRRYSELVDEIAEMPATTAAALAVKARIALRQGTMAGALIRDAIALGSQP